MNQARRFLRERAEAGSRSQDTEQRKALGKLVYVSYLVFGAQQAAFLMPLRRVFSIQPASIDVMRRDNAKQLFDNYIKAHGGELQVSYPFMHSFIYAHNMCLPLGSGVYSPESPPVQGPVLALQVIAMQVHYMFTPSRYICTHLQLKMWVDSVCAIFNCHYFYLPWTACLACACLCALSVVKHLLS